MTARGIAARASALLLGLILVLPAGASARAPTLRSVGQSDRHLQASWTLPPGVEAQDLVASTSSTPDEAFGLTGAEYQWGLSANQTSLTSPERLTPGAYYVRVSGMDTGDPLLSSEWSNILRVVIPAPPKPPPAKPRPGRYSGRMQFPDSRPISFTLSRNRRRIRNLRIRFRLDCTRGGFPVGELRGKVTVKRLRVRRNHRFSSRFTSPSAGNGRLRVRLTGRFRPPLRAGGTLNATARLPDGVRCRIFVGRLRWSAQRR